MKKVSRHETRECLLQALYGRSILGERFDLGIFLESYFDERYADISKDAYFSEAFAGIVTREGELCSVVRKFAPKFEIQMMPVVNLLPVFIAAFEMLYLECDKVPEKVSIDEAIELTKKFSDENSRTLVNGVLNSLKNDREVFKAELAAVPEVRKFGIF
jgi:N utilization substance protein B